MNKFISESNLNKLNELNSLLKEAGLKRKIEIEFVDKDLKFGINIYIPSILNEDGIEPFKTHIIKDVIEYGVIGAVKEINKDFKELFDAIEYDFKKIVRIKESFKLVSNNNNNINNISSTLDNNTIFDFKYYEGVSRHN